MNKQIILTAAVLTLAPVQASSQVNMQYPQHDTLRPAPKVVRPATVSAGTRVGRAPSDAMVLYDGHDLSKWTSGDGKPAEWFTRDGYFEVAKGKGTLTTRDSFGDVQLHIEWASPTPAVGVSQDRGNSGVFFGAGRYEVQILDSYGSATYPDGQAASLYGQYPPLVNASLPPGEWQTYDIIYRRPRFRADGTVEKPAYVTVIHNGVLVQDHAELIGPTANRSRPPYSAHADRLPISLQDHGHPVRFRNIWLRDLESGS